MVKIDLDYKFNWIFDSVGYGLGQEVKEIRKS